MLIGTSPSPPKPERRSEESVAAEREKESEATRSESLIPSLAPMVQGLDSVVIPAPLAGARPDKREDEPAPPSDALPIDDPDGVLDNRR